MRRAAHPMRLPGEPRRARAGRPALARRARHRAAAGSRTTVAPASAADRASDGDRLGRSPQRRRARRSRSRRASRSSGSRSRRRSRSPAPGATRRVAVQVLVDGTPVASGRPAADGTVRVPLPATVAVGRHAVTAVYVGAPDADRARPGLVGHRARAHRHPDAAGRAHRRHRLVGRPRRPEGDPRPGHRGRGRRADGHGRRAGSTGSRKGIGDPRPVGRGRRDPRDVDQDRAGRRHLRRRRHLPAVGRVAAAARS